MVSRGSQGPLTHDFLGKHRDNGKESGTQILPALGMSSSFSSLLKLVLSFFLGVALEYILIFIYSYALVITYNGYVINHSMYRIIT